MTGIPEAERSAHNGTPEFADRLREEEREEREERRRRVSLERDEWERVPGEWEGR